MVLIDKLLPKLRERGSRVLIFSQMTRLLDILEDYCIYRQYRYCRIDGNTSGDDREYAIDEFNRDGSEMFIFLLSTRAGGLGINLATADIVILFDSDWNPQMDLQAMDRAHRIGQKKEVQVFRLCIENSIEEKVIEKAYKKLRLDAMVIQQGRLTENRNTKVNKDDLLNMVRYGAELVFSSGAGNITEADIDSIIQKGEKDTMELNEKMKEFTENAMKFTLDGGISLYDYKEDEQVEAPAGMDLKAIISNNWVDPPKRERRRVLNYSETEYYKQALKTGKTERSTGPRLPKMPHLQDFQFYDIPRLTELFEKENNYEIWKHQQNQKEESKKSEGGSEDGNSVKELNEDDPQPLTEEEQLEKAALLEEGFSNWNRRDFNAFVRACEKWGRKDLAKICIEVEGKTEEEIKNYSKAFWERFQELNDWERILKNIEKGEQKIQRHQDIANALQSKVGRYRNPWNELKIYYGANKGKAYTEEEDRFIICKTNELGYGNWDQLKTEIRKSWRFRFDWFIKSRTPQELSRRCDTLIRLIEKENEDLESDEQSKKGSKRISASGKGSDASGPPVGKKRKTVGAAGPSGS